MAAMAASTAEPLALRMTLPILEHLGVSVATASFLWGLPDAGSSDDVSESFVFKYTTTPIIAATTTITTTTIMIMMIVLQEKH